MCGTGRRIVHAPAISCLAATKERFDRKRGVQIKSPFLVLYKGSMQQVRGTRACAAGQLETQLHCDPSLKLPFKDLGLDKLDVVRTTYLSGATLPR
jgi:hypothetical protein